MDVMGVSCGKGRIVVYPRDGEKAPILGKTNELLLPPYGERLVWSGG